MLKSSLETQTHVNYTLLPSENRHQTKFVVKSRLIHVCSVILVTVFFSESDNQFPGALCPSMRHGGRRKEGGKQMEAQGAHRSPK